MNELEQMVLDYVRKEYLDEGDPRMIGVDTPLITGGIVDSFSMVSLKRCPAPPPPVRIPDAEATPTAFDTVRRIVELVERIRAGAVAV
jgi:hypothetical protein